MQTCSVLTSTCDYQNKYLFIIDKLIEISVISKKRTFICFALKAGNSSILLRVMELGKKGERTR